MVCTFGSGCHLGLAPALSVGRVASRTYGAVDVRTGERMRWGRGRRRDCAATLLPLLRLPSRVRLGGAARQSGRSVHRAGGKGPACVVGSEGWCGKLSLTQQRLSVLQAVVEEDGWKRLLEGLGVVDERSEL